MTFRTRLLVVFAATIVAAGGHDRVDCFQLPPRARSSSSMQSARRRWCSSFKRNSCCVARKWCARPSVSPTPMLRCAWPSTSTVPEPDYSLHVNDAAALAASHGLDFLELVAGDGSIVSSAQWPARFAYKETWLTEPVDWKSQPAFLKREDLPDDAALALEAVRVPLGRRCAALRDCRTAPGCRRFSLPWSCRPACASCSTAISNRHFPRRRWRVLARRMPRNSRR